MKNKEFLKEVGNFIKWNAVKNRQSHKDLINNLDISNSMLHQIYKGELLTLVTTVRIFKLLDLNLNELFPLYESTIKEEL